MRSRTLEFQIGLALIVALACAVWAVRGVGDGWGARDRPPANTAFVVPPAVPVEGGEASSRDSIRFLEEKVRRDPEDAGAASKLAANYLQVLRETGSLAYLDLAARAARRSLDSVPVVRNTAGLTALTLVDFASHDFAAARDGALQLTTLEPEKSYPYAMLGDAFLELGQYERATRAFTDMQRRSHGISENTETRLGRLAQLHGDTASATRHFSAAVVLALNLALPPREAIAWSRWQLGETAFNAGDYAAAEKNYRDALITFPGYYRALASLGRVLAARGDRPSAIAAYEDAIRHLPDPTFVAALGDLYTLAGRDRDAATQYGLVEAIGHLGAVNGVLYNRQLALFYADHDLKPAEAYAHAKREYAARRDIYGADALAWTALKAGKIREAQGAMRDALRLGTQDPRFFYHAGMIARAAGDERSGRDWLRRALALSPQFDPLQSEKARKALQ